MINVTHARMHLDALRTETAVFSKAQVAEMLHEIEVGQQARRALTNIKMIVGIAASTVGAPA